MIDITSTIPRHPTKKWKVRKKPPEKIVVHCTGGTNQSPIATARYHVGPNHISKSGCSSLCYSDFLDNKGTVFHCNDYQFITWHCGAWNSKTIGIVMAYEGKEERPPEIQYKTLIDHLANLCLEFGILPSGVIGHREVPGYIIYLGNGSKRYRTTCPSLSIDLDNLRKDVAISLQKLLKEVGLYKSSIDGIFGPKSLAAFQTVVSFPKHLQPRNKYNAIS